MASELRTWADEKGLPAELTAAMKTVLMEKPVDAKARLIELLSGPARQGVFTPANAKGGTDFVPTKAAAVFIEYQNEFTTEGGKLYDGVKAIMEANDMLKKSADVAAACRKAGVKIMHVPITFSKDATDNPNKKLGILKGCADGELFTEGTWNAEICDAMKKQEGDFVVTGKKGLDAFPGTDLEALLRANGIETVILGGFLTNCCVESTMRTAYEKGFNVITLKDCCATMSEAGQGATAESFNFFSTPMTAEEFMATLPK